MKTRGVKESALPMIFCFIEFVNMISAVPTQGRRAAVPGNGVDLSYNNIAKIIKTAPRNEMQFDKYRFLGDFMGNAIIPPSKSSHARGGKR